MKPISRPDAMPFLRAERRVRASRWWWDRKSRPMPFRLPRARRALMEESLPANRIRARLYRTLPWTWEPKRPRRT